MLGAVGLRERMRLAATEVGLALAGLVAGWLLASAVMSGLSSVLGAGPWRQAFGLVTGPIVTAAAALVYYHVSKVLDAQAGPRQSRTPALAVPSGAHTWSFVVGGVAAALGGSIALGLLMKLLGGPVEEQAVVLAIVEEARTGGSVVPAVALCISATAFAPVAEEWLFRGLLFRRIGERTGLVAAYLLSASLFAAIHGNLAGLPVYIWLGVVFAFTYRATHGLWPAIVVHMANNAVVLLMLFLGVE